jgi:hypothetical protein
MDLFGGRAVAVLASVGGAGIAQTPAGPYTIHVWFSPSPSGSRILPSASISGSAYVCTPTGKRYTLKVTGGAIGRIWKDMDGHSFRLYASNGPFFVSVTGDHRPRLNFSGSWVGPNLQMDDEGTIAQAFLADGSLSPGPGLGGSHIKEKAVPITFTETSSWWRGSCGKP